MEKMKIREAKKADLEGISNLFNTLSATDKKYLALDKKMSIIKQNTRNGRHVFVAESVSQIVGFARESGRPNKFIMLEEIVIHPDFREKGVGSKLLQFVIERHPKIEAKTLAVNDKIALLLEKHGFSKVKTSPKGEIIYWQRA